jgi:O-6-methylguanine DNA methyltransferase
MTETPTSQAVEASLAGLRSTAPQGLAERILVATGHADQYDTVASTVGALIVAFTKDGISVVAPADRTDDFSRDYFRFTGREVTPGRLPTRLRSGVERVLQTGKLGSLPVDLSHLTDFQRAVLKKTAEIPRGQMRSYGWIAKEIGNTGAVRAVGSALNKNPVPVLIPCHRVGNSDGSIGNYAYGPEMKHELLEHEGLDTESLQQLAARGISLTGSDTTSIYCFPTCSHAKRTTEQHRVEFRSVKQAKAAGYRACKVCRPAA